MSYNGNLTAECWKIHTCVNCATLLRYKLSRSVSATANSEIECRNALGEAAQKALEGGVDHHPCPNCGLVQPEMVGAQRNGIHAGSLWGSVFLLIGLPICLATDVTISTWVVIGFVLALLMVLVHWYAAASNPNTRLEANRALAGLEVQARRLFSEPPEEPQTTRSAGELADLTDGSHPKALGLLAVGLLLIALPEVARVGRGWSANPNWYPAVIGPGDTATYYFHQRISSIKGYWKGDVKAEIVDGAQLKATTNQNAWGNSMSVKSSEKNSSSSLWAKVDFPGEPALAGKKAAIRMQVNYVKPEMSGAKSFREVEGKVDEAPDVKFSSPNAGAQYLLLARLGAIGGPLCLLIGGIMLRSRALGMSGNRHLALRLEAFAP